MRKLLVVLCVSTLAACGGGGSGGTATPAAVNYQPASVPATPVVSAPPSTAAADLALASRLYKGDERTPAGFEVETRPASVVGTLSTLVAITERRTASSVGAAMQSAWRGYNQVAEIIITERPVQGASVG